MSVSIEFLVVGGGGAGRNGQGAGGGGGGGVVAGTRTIPLANATPMWVQVGAGGTPASTTASDGSPSSWRDVIAFGGGGADRDGASGGGGAGRTSAPADAGGSAIYNSVGFGTQGYGGGTGSINVNGIGGGGGGGAGGAGGNAPNTPPTANMGAGGIGVLSSISGSSVGYGGGGGGGGYSPTGQLAGQAVAGYGGGNGGQSSILPQNGTANRGGGGGGAQADQTANQGSNGGSGVVILRYLTASVTAIGSGGTITTSGGYTIHTFTASAYFTPPTQALAAPTGITASPASGSVTLSWTDNAFGGFYDVYQHTSDSFGGASLAEVQVQGVGSVVVYGLTPSTTYYFWLRTRTAAGETSSQSSSVAATTLAVSIPAAPTLTRTA